MDKQAQRKLQRNFLLRICLPTFLAIGLFVSATFAVLIPAFEQRVMDDKRDMIRELTHTAWSIIEECHAKEEAGEWDRETARQRAVERIRDMRYGSMQKDYFWITDMTPVMVMHPYRPELNGKNLRDFEEYGNRHLFVQCVEIVKQRNSGYLEYKWQWKDDPNKIVPKLSYVEGFKAWDWVIGTGIYLDDVSAEISAMKRRLTLVSLVIILISAALLAVSAQQSFRSESERQEAEGELQQSRAKYKAMVGAATEGLVMIIENRYFYSNQKTRELLGCYTEREFASLPMFDPQAELGPETLSGATYFHSLVRGEDVPNQYEVQMPRKDGSHLDAVLLRSTIDLGGQEGQIVIIKDLSGEHHAAVRNREMEQEQLIVDLQTSLMILNQPLEGYLKPLCVVDMNEPVNAVARQLRRKNNNAALVKTESGQFIGLITISDLVQRVLAEDGDKEQPVHAVMSSPIDSVSAQSLVFEAGMLMEQRNVHHLAVKDNKGKYVSIISDHDLLRIQSYSVAGLIGAVQSASSVDEICTAMDRLPMVAKALIDSGARARNVTHILSSVSEIILATLLKKAISDLGEPPVPFTFLALGSEGRCEETLLTDQDNAILYQDVPKNRKKEVHQYFMELGQKVCKWLDQVGYHYCKGEIMASNPKWCLSLDEWKDNFTNWIAGSTPQGLLEFNIFFDLRAGYGDESLVEELHSHIHQLTAEHPAFFFHLAQNCLLYKPPIGMFGKIAVKSSGEYSDTFSIKEALKPVINFARIYAIQNGITISNTLERLTALKEAGVLSDGTHGDMVDVYNHLMQLRFRHQANAMRDGREPDNHINPNKLSSIEQELLKKSLSQISIFQSKISFDFKGST